MLLNISSLSSFPPSLPSLPPKFAFPIFSQNLPEQLIDDTFFNFELLRDLPKPQALAYKAIFKLGKTGSLFNNLLPRVNAWLTKYFGKASCITIDDLSVLGAILPRASSHFSMGIIKTLCNAWCTSTRFGGLKRAVHTCAYCSAGTDAMHHLLLHSVSNAIKGTRRSRAFSTSSYQPTIFPWQTSSAWRSLPIAPCILQDFASLLLLVRSITSSGAFLSHRP